MANKKSIDVANNQAGTVFIGVRLSAKQTMELDELAVKFNTTRSGLIRTLIRKETTNVSE